MATCTTNLISIDGMPAQPAGPPQGRLTLVAAMPVITSDQTGKTTIYYTPYVGVLASIYDGTNLLATPFSELTNITSNSSVGNAGPAAVTTNSNYDLFVWNNSGTVTLTRGPAWTSDTARGTGAGTTELQRVKGLLTNAVAITNGPAANLGTYVGTVRTDASAATVSWQAGAVANGGTPANLHVWNAYNRLSVRGLVGESTASWTYTTAAWRPAGGSTRLRASLVVGLQEDFFWGSYSASVSNNSGSVNIGAAIAYDVTNAPTGRYLGSAGATTSQMTVGGDHSVQALGFHFMQAIEISGVGGTTTWIGTGAAGVTQTGLTYQGQF